MYSIPSTCYGFVYGRDRELDSREGLQRLARCAKHSCAHWVSLTHEVPSTQSVVGVPSGSAVVDSPIVEHGVQVLTRAPDPAGASLWPRGCSCSSASMSSKLSSAPCSRWLRIRELISWKANPPCWQFWVASHQHGLREPVQLTDRHVHLVSAASKRIELQHKQYERAKRLAQPRRAAPWPSGRLLGHLQRCQIGLHLQGHPRCGSCGCCLPAPPHGRVSTSASGMRRCRLWRCEVKHKHIGTPPPKLPVHRFTRVAATNLLFAQSGTAAAGDRPVVGPNTFEQ